MRPLTVLALLLLLLLCPSPAGAQGIDSVSVYATGGKSVTNWHGQAGVVGLNVELRQAWSRKIDVGVIVTPMSIRQPRSWFGDDYGDGNESVNAYGGALFVRRNFRLRDRNWQGFVELATGPLWAEKRVPAATSRFNFASQAALGVTFLPDSATPLIVGYRFMHISNGGYADRNPGLNVSCVMIGTQIRFGR